MQLHFLANTKESNYEATTQKKIDNTYRSIGLELDGIVSITNNLNLRAGLTYTKGEITAARDTSIVGNIPRRLPAVMFNLIPSYSIGSKVNIGFALLGFTKSYAQDNNSLVMPGYLVLNPFINYNIGKYLSLNLSGNNVLNALGITESEEGSITENTSNIVRARPIPGRTFSFGVKYNF
ncbi:MAG: TonB-dependent receptor [Saprospiraceae bacterium]|nr:TonB-dependent receptor [Saprospiraceae bacterium]